MENPQELDCNILKELPDSIGDLSSLEELKIFKNNLISFPNLTQLPINLRKIDLGRNPLQTLPDVITKYQPSLKLKKIYIDEKYNHLFDENARRHWVDNRNYRL